MRSGAWRDVSTYFALVTVLTVPFWIAGSIVETRLMPGLSITAFAIVVPMISACVVTLTAGGLVEVKSLFASLLRPGRHMMILGALAVTVPLIVAGFSWNLLEPKARTLLPPPSLWALVPIFLLAAVAEEIGWSAFASRQLAQEMHLVVVGLAVGLFWVVWHIPSLIELGRSVDWIAWWSLWTVAQRLIMVCLYVRSDYWLWAPIILHTTSNVAWQADPESFDPRVQGITMAVVSVVAVFTVRK